MKSNFSNCDKCPLVKNHVIAGETNCEDDISKVDLLILAEAPASEEINQNRPLVGKAGKIFREAFSKSGLDKCNYFISNVVLCDNIQEDGKTDNPPQEAIDCCSSNWKKLIEFTKPKVVLLLGSIPMKIFGISDSGITKIRGSFFKASYLSFYKEINIDNDFDILLTVHPSFIQRNGGMNTEEGIKFLEDFNKISSMFNINKQPIKEFQLDKPYSFMLPNWCYSDDVCLINIQNIKETNTILYIFRDKKGNKIYHKIDSKDTYYYTTNEQNIANSPMILPVNKATLIKGSLPSSIEQATYESDLRTEIKHAIDYRYNRKNEEFNPKLKILYVDIEVYSAGDRSFPDPKEAKRPINSISFKLNNEKTYIYLCKLNGMDSKEPTIPDNYNVKFFDNEEMLLEAFCSKVRELNPDIMCGWNFLNFDIVTIYGRMTRNKIPFGKLSPINLAYCNKNSYGNVCIYGMHVMDMLDLYKELSQSVEPSYKLNSIAQKILGSGKVAYEGTLDTLYETDISKFLLYSGTDTDLLYELNEKLGHIDLKYELIKICASTWKAAENTTGLIDPLCVLYAKNINMVCRNALPIIESGESIPGAYVRNPIAGQHGYLIDFDFASLYPSIICSFNIGPNTYFGKVDESTAFDVVYRKDVLDRNKTIDFIEDPIMQKSSKKQMTIGKLIDMIDDKKLIVTPAGTIYKNHEDELSFFTKILIYLLDSRKEYKDKQKVAKGKNDEELFKLFYNCQWAYKILANSLYGVLANEAFRFFNLDLAKSVTLSGQELIKYSGYHLGRFMKDKHDDIDISFLKDYDTKDIPYIVYQDTDSIFVAMGDYMLDENIVTYTSDGKLKIKE